MPIECIKKPILIDQETWQGSTFLRLYRLTQPDGTPIDLYGYTGKMQLRDTPDAPVDLELSSANGRIIIEETNLLSGLASSSGDVVTVTDIVPGDIAGKYVTFDDPTKFYKVVERIDNNNVRIDQAITIANVPWSTIEKGQIKLLVDAATMAAMTPKVYEQYELDLMIGSDVITYMIGRFAILAEHTK